MAYREKQAWLNFITMAVAYSIYFPLSQSQQRAPLDNLLLFGIIAAAHAVTVIAGMILLAIQIDKDGRQADERDHAIARRGAAAAYYVLMTGTIIVGVVMPFTESGWKISNAALFALVVAMTVQSVVILWSYRRGWHG